MPIAKLDPKQPPSCKRLTGTFVQLEHLDPIEHAAGLERHLCGAANTDLWDYIPFDAPADAQALMGIMAYMAEHLGWYVFAMRDLASGEITGTVSLMRIRPEHGSAEVGCVVFGKSLQRSPAATEAIYLLADYLFGTLDYRRFEWKCDNLNEASRRAAARFGFAYEGVFRNDMIVKGRNRDTAWFAMTDRDWVDLAPAYKAWLADTNFDERGVQRTSLKDHVAAAL